MVKVILILLDRMHLLFTQVYFLFWQPDRVGGQYTTEAISSLSGKPLKLIDQFTYLGSNISSTEKLYQYTPPELWLQGTAIIWKSVQSDKIKCSCVNTSIWMHNVETNKRKTNKKLHGNYTKMLRAVLNHHHHHVVPLARISLTTSRHFPYRSSPQAGLQGYIPYPHIAAVCLF